MTTNGVDRFILKGVLLDDIVDELERRGCQTLYGNGLGLRGRVIFVPASLEEMRELAETYTKSRVQRKEVRGRVSTQPSKSEGGVGVSSDGQSVRDLHEARSNTSEGEQSSGHDSDRQAYEFADRVQRSEERIDTVPETGTTSVAGAPGFPGEGRE